MRCFFISDVHGHQHRYEQLFKVILKEAPDVVFLGGDLLPAAGRSAASRFPLVNDFVAEYLTARFAELRKEMGEAYPHVCIILGNDDPRCIEERLRDAAYADLWHYLHMRCSRHDDMLLYGYNYVPPTPFQFKDWERYDVSRYVEPGCVSPEEGHRSVTVDAMETRYATIQQDLATLAGDADLSRAVMLFHAPPYNTALDRAALDGRFVDHVPLDVHVGSVAIRKFILARTPRVTLHGHIHESASITGSWKEQLGATWCLSAAHNGHELALVRFDSADPAAATRELL